MSEKQTGGLMSFWKSLRSKAWTPDPVISPDAPSRLDMGWPSLNQYPTCDGPIPIDGGVAEATPSDYRAEPVKSYS